MKALPLHRRFLPAPTCARELLQDIGHPPLPLHVHPVGICGEGTWWGGHECQDAPPSLGPGSHPISFVPTLGACPQPEETRPHPTNFLPVPGGMSPSQGSCPHSVSPSFKPCPHPGDLSPMPWGINDISAGCSQSPSPHSWVAHPHPREPHPNPKGPVPTSCPHPSSLVPTLGTCPQSCRLSSSSSSSYVGGP